MKLSLALLALAAGAQCNTWFGNAGKLSNLGPAMTSLCPAIRGSLRQLTDSD